MHLETIVARASNKGIYFCAKSCDLGALLIEGWVHRGGEQDCFADARSGLMMKEYVMLHVRKWISGAGERRFRLCVKIFVRAQVQY